MNRWSLDVSCEESRTHLGIEMQRQWSVRAIECAMPLRFGLSSLAALSGQVLHPDGNISAAQAAWYCKQTASFRDVFAGVRWHLWNLGLFPLHPLILAWFSSSALRLSACPGPLVMMLEMYTVKLRSRLATSRTPIKTREGEDGRLSCTVYWRVLYARCKRSAS